MIESTVGQAMSLPVVPYEESSHGKSNVLRMRLLSKAAEKCIPLTASLEITLRCNLRCVHCYNFDRSAPPPSSEDELTPAEIFSAIDQLKEAGCLYLAFTGGEALVHPHLEDFIRHARKRRLAVRVKTNGALLTPAKVEMLARAGTRSLDVSLYGATAGTHDAFTVRRGSFDKTIEGIRRAIDAGLAVQVNMSIVKSNASEVAEMLRLVRDLDVSYSINPFITARYDGTVSSLDHTLDHATLEELYRGPLKSLVRPPDFDPGRSVQCGCARVNCGISATGEVYPCIGAPVPSGNLRQQSFAEIWRDSPQLNRIRGLVLDDFETCRTCPDRPYCGRNSGVVYTNTGEYTGPETFTCLEAGVTRDVYSADETESNHQPLT